MPNHVHADAIAAGDCHTWPNLIHDLKPVAWAVGNLAIWVETLGGSARDCCGHQHLHVVHAHIQPFTHMLSVCALHACQHA